MKNFLKGIRHPGRILMMQIYSLCMFALFISFVYFPYKNIDVDLFPFYIYKVSVNALWYYAVIYICIWIFVQLRLFMLDRLKDNFSFPQLVFLDVMMGVLGLPLFIFPGFRIFGGLALEFGLLLFVIDWMWLYKRHLNFIHIVVVLLVFVSIVLLMVNWHNDKSQLEKASDLVDYCRLYDDWNFFNDSWAVAQYTDGQLCHSTGWFQYPEFYDVSLDREGFNRIVFREYDSHYLYRYGSSIFVASCPSWSPLFRYLVNFSHIFSVYLLITILVLLILSRLGLVYQLNNSFFSRLQYTLLVFMLVCMLLVLVLVSLYIGSKYERMSRNTHQYTTELFLNYMNPIVDRYCGNEAVLSYKLERIASVLKTDIVLYDSNGDLFLQSDSSMNIVCHNIDDLRDRPFSNMPTRIYVRMIRYEGSVLMISYSVMFCPDHSPIYAVIFNGIDRNVIDHEITSFVVLVMNIYFLVMIISIVLSYFVSKKFSAPLEMLEAKMRKVDFTGDNEKIDYSFTHDDALSKLVEQYNIQLDKLKEAAEQIALAEREESWRLMARQIAHEIRNPLTPMKLLSQRLSSMEFEDRDSYVEAVRSSCGVLLQCIDNVNATTYLLSDFARTSLSNPSEVNVVELVQGVVGLFQNNEHNVSVEFFSEFDSAYILVDKDMVMRVFNNLINNAIQSVPDGREGHVRVSLSSDGRSVSISVADNGCGISEENIGRIFNVSFSTKVKGMGLGLCVVRNVVNASGGQLSVESVVDKGSVFTVSFPLSDGFNGVAGF